MEKTIKKGPAGKSRPNQYNLKTNNTEATPDLQANAHRLGEVYDATNRQAISLRCMAAKLKEVEPTYKPKFKPLPELARLEQLLSYDPDTGCFIALRSHAKSKAGEIAGWNSLTNGKGYWCLSVDGKPYFAHRIAWKMHYRCELESILDHINGDRLDNRTANLRLSTPMENSRNRHSISSNTGILGVSWLASRERYYASISYFGHNINLGYYISIDCALKARRFAQRILFQGYMPQFGGA